jgi:hypothetical protein
MYWPPQSTQRSRPHVVVVKRDHQPTRARCQCRCFGHRAGQVDVDDVRGQGTNPAWPRWAHGGEVLAKGGRPHDPDAVHVVDPCPRPIAGCQDDVLGRPIHTRQVCQNIRHAAALGRGVLVDVHHPHAATVAAWRALPGSRNTGNVWFVYLTGMARIWLCLLSMCFLAVPTFAQESGEVWPSHVSDAGGYIVDYPPSWAIEEFVDESGSVATTFSDVSGAVLIVSSQPGATAEPVLDFPNVRCQTVIVGGLLQGQRCLDTVSRSIVITLIAPDRTYSLGYPFGSAARDDIEVVLNSFRLVPAPAVD